MRYDTTEQPVYYDRNRKIYGPIIPTGGYRHSYFSGCGTCGMGQPEPASQAYWPVALIGGGVVLGYLLRKKLKQPGMPEIAVPVMGGLAGVGAWMVAKALKEG
jgi:hypothetical protein